MTNKQYPRGKLNAADEGELLMRVAIREGTVVIDFGKPIVWIGLGAKEAREIARKLLELADRIES